MQSTLKVFPQGSTVSLIKQQANTESDKLSTVENFFKRMKDYARIYRAKDSDEVAECESIMEEDFKEKTLQALTHQAAVDMDRCYFYDVAVVTPKNSPLLAPQNKIDIYSLKGKGDLVRVDKML